MKWFLRFCIAAPVESITALHCSLSQLLYVRFYEAPVHLNINRFLPVIGSPARLAHCWAAATAGPPGRAGGGEGGRAAGVRQSSLIETVSIVSRMLSTLNTIADIFVCHLIVLLILPPGWKNCNEPGLDFDRTDWGMIHQRDFPSLTPSLQATACCSFNDPTFLLSANTACQN